MLLFKYDFGLRWRSYMTKNCQTNNNQHVNYFGSLSVACHRRILLILQRTLSNWYGWSMFTRDLSVKYGGQSFIFISSFIRIILTFSPYPGWSSCIMGIFIYNFATQVIYFAFLPPVSLRTNRQHDVMDFPLEHK